MLPGPQSSESHPDPPYLCMEGPSATGKLTKPQGLCGTGSQAGGITECLLAHQAPSRGVVVDSLTVASRSPGREGVNFQASQRECGAINTHSPAIYSHHKAEPQS